MNPKTMLAGAVTTIALVVGGSTAVAAVEGTPAPVEQTAAAPDFDKGRGTPLLEGVLSELVSDKTLTTDQADAVSGAVADARAEKTIERKANRAEKKAEHLKRAAELLGVDVADLEAELVGADNLKEMLPDAGVGLPEHAGPGKRRPRGGPRN